VLVLGTLLALSLTGSAPGQQINDPAAVLPDRTLLYAELRQPGALAREIAALFEGSALADVPGSLARFRAGHEATAPSSSEGLAALGAFLSPEVIREAGRIRGAAVALTGLGKEKDMPEFVAVILPGESNAPGFLMRLILATSATRSTTSDGKGRTEVRTSFEPVGEVGGVRLYRQVERRLTGPAAPGGPEGKPEVRQRGPACAMLPGALLVGSPDAVRDVIRRAQGAVKEPSLASVETYQEASRQLGREPGLFVWSDPAALLDAVEKAGLGRQEREVLGVIKGVVNPRGVRTKAGSLSLHEGNLTARTQYWLNPGEKHPLLEVLPTAPVDTQLVHFAPRDAMLYAEISNDDGEKRFARLLELVDGIAKATDAKGVPSEAVGQIETALGIKIGPDVAAKVADVAVAIAGPQHLAAGREGKVPVPVVVIIRASDEKAAQTLAGDLLPKVVGLVSQERGLEPQEKEVEGQRVATLTPRGGHPVSYGRHGAVLVVGADPALVAEALNEGTKKRGLLADEKVRAELLGPNPALVTGITKEGPIDLVVLKPMTLIGSFLVPVRWQAEGPGAPGAAAAPAAADKGLPEFLKVAEKEGPLVIGVSRKPDRVLIEARYTGLRRLVPSLTDFLIQERYGSRQESRTGS
jgi:hypothetical protein